MNKSRTFWEQGFAPILSVGQTKLTTGYSIVRLTPSEVPPQQWDHMLILWDSWSPSDYAKDKRAFNPLFKIAVEDYGLTDYYPGRPDLIRLASRLINRWIRQGEDFVAPTLPKDFESWPKPLVEDWYFENNKDTRIGVDLSDYQRISFDFMQLWHLDLSGILNFYNCYGSVLASTYWSFDPVSLIKAESHKFATFWTLCKVFREYETHKDALLQLEQHMRSVWLPNEMLEGQYAMDLLMQYTNCELIVRFGPSIVKYPEVRLLFSGSSSHYLKRTETIDGWKDIAEEFLFEQTQHFYDIKPKLESYGLRLAPSCLLADLYSKVIQTIFGKPLPRKCPYVRCNNFLTQDGSLSGEPLRTDAKTCGDSRCQRWYQRNKGKL